MILNFRASLLSEMIGAISASDADPQDVLYAVDADGEVVCWPADNTQWSEAQLASIAAACRGKAQANGAFAQKEPDGETYIVTYAVSRTGDWLFVEMTHSRQVLHQLWFVFLEVAATAVVAMAAAVMASFWTARKLYRPIEKLNAHVRTQMPPASGTGKTVRTDELNSVSQAFDAMVHSTAELEQQTRHNELRMANVLLRRLLLGELSPANSDVQRLLEEKGIAAADTAERNCALVLVKLSAYQNVEERYSEAERDACAYGVVNIGEELLGKRYTCAGAHMGKGQFCFLLQFDAQEAPNVLFDVRGIAESLQDALAQVYHGVRMEKIRTLLDTTRLSLGDILQQVGMERNNYFYTLFRKYFGVSFASYPRRSARSGGPDDKSASKAD